MSFIFSNRLKYEMIKSPPCATKEKTIAKKKKSGTKKLYINCEGYKISITNWIIKTDNKEMYKVHNYVLIFKSSCLGHASVIFIRIVLLSILKSNKKLTFLSSCIKWSGNLFLRNIANSYWILASL